MRETHFPNFLWLILLSVLLSTPHLLSGQTYDAPRPTPISSTEAGLAAWHNYLLRQIDLGLMTEDEAEDAEALYEQFLTHPIEVNHATEEDLSQLPYASSYQIYQLIHYRTNHYQLRDLSELKLIPGWTPETIIILAPLLRCYAPDEVQLARHTITPRQQLQMHYSRAGSTRGDKADDLGTNDRAVFQWSYQKAHSYRLFLAAEKDAREPWKYGTHRGFDSYNASAQIYRKHWKLSLGDFRVSRATGLVLGQGVFSLSGRGIAPRIAQGIRPLSRSTEREFMRGLALQIEHSSWTMGAFLSKRAVDGQLSKEGRITGYSEDGLHTTPRLWDKRQNIPLRSAGAWFSLGGKQLHMGLQLFAQDWSGNHLQHLPGWGRTPIAPRTAPSISGSIDYSWRSRSGKSRLLGELAYSPTWGGIAWLQHLSLLQRSWGGATLSLWYASPKYWSLYAHSATHSSRPVDERGMRLLWAIPPISRFRDMLLSIEGYAPTSSADRVSKKRSGWRFSTSGAMQLTASAQLALRYSWYSRDGQSSHRARLQLIRSNKEETFRVSLQAGWEEFRHTSWAGSIDWTHTLHPSLLITLQADYVHAEQWSQRLYTTRPKIQGLYGFDLLSGVGYDMTLRLRYRPSQTLRLEMLGGYQKRSTRGIADQKWQAGLALSYRF